MKPTFYYVAYTKRSFKGSVKHELGHKMFYLLLAAGAAGLAKAKLKCIGDQSV